MNPLRVLLDVLGSTASHFVLGTVRANDAIGIAVLVYAC